MKYCSASGKITIKKSEWVKLGHDNGWFREAMTVPLPQEIRQRMAEEGIYSLLNLQDVKKPMPHSKKTAIEKVIQDQGVVELFNELSPITVLELPKIYFYNKNNLVEINGNTYYLAHVIESKDPKRADKKRGLEGGVHYDGKIICIDLASGEPVEFSYDEYKDKIKSASDKREETRVVVNQEIDEWNRRLEEIDKALGVTKFALQFRWVEGKVEDRIGVLEGQLQGIEAKRNSPQSVAYEEWMNFLHEGIQGGEFNIRDSFDTLLFLYKMTPSELVSGINSGEVAVPEEIKSALLAVAELEVRAEQEARQKREEKGQSREDRIDAPIENEPEVSTLSPMDISQIPETKYKSATEYQTLKSWQDSLVAQSIGISRDLEELQGVQSTFESVRVFLGELESGQRAKDYLAGEGSGIVNELENFIDQAKSFIKRYAVDVIKDGTINPSLMGRKGDMGNALIGVSLFRIYAIIKETLEAIMPEIEQRRMPTDSGEEPIEAKTDVNVEKLSTHLWQAFEKRFRLR